MDIRRDLKADGTFAPRAVNLLPNLPNAKLFHSEHGSRHPDSIYSISLEKVGKAFTRVIEEYRKSSIENLIAVQNTLQVDDLLKFQIELLRTEQEHIDDCFLILKTLVDPTTAKKKSLFSANYIIENKLPGAKKFVAAIDGVKNSLRIANKIKHSQGILRGIAIRPYGRLHLGYFLEEPVDKGVMGASKEIHPNGGAFSFARDLSQRLYDIYFCSEKLCSAISSAMITLHGISIPETPVTANKLWDELAKLASEIPENVFPKESESIMPQFRLNETLQHLVISPNHHARLQFQRSLSVSFSTVIDRYNNSFRVPIP